jgi:hypothetical protein
MKSIHRLPAILALYLTVLTPSLFAQLNVPSDGSDGALNASASTVINLSQAVTGVWSQNNSANAGYGVYDPTNWAVVFKYSSVDIEGTNTTITFANHYGYPPVIWLVQSNVTINGTVNLNGQPTFSGAVPQEYTPAEPGPGGFRGGPVSPAGEGDGYGPGGGIYTGTDNGQYSGVYGNPQILPLIGGSGASGNWGYNGPAGGGAILIVAGGTVTVNGSITANGSSWRGFGGTGDSSSGGAIRIVANQILGTGTIDASQANPGRTRMEANVLSPQLNIFPNVIAVSPGTTPVIFPPANTPTVQIISVGSQPAPSDPTATLASSADIGIQNTNAVNIVLQTQNFPIQGVLTLRVTPKYGGATILYPTYVSGNVNQASWQVSAVLPAGFCTLQARATAP